MIPYQSVHVVGANTPEMMSVIAYLRAQKINVSASDEQKSRYFAGYLQKMGVPFETGLDLKKMTIKPEALVLSPFVLERDKVVLAARELRIPVLTAVELIKTMTADKEKLVVLGDYQGPVIATWLSHIWSQAHLPVSAMTKTALIGEGTDFAQTREADWVILPMSGFKRNAASYEADFLSLEAENVIIPSIVYDYPELYSTLDDVYQAYYTFVRRIPRKGMIIGDGDFPRMKRLQGLLADRHIETYGFDRDASWQIRDVEEHEGNTEFYLIREKTTYGPLTIPFVGDFFVTSAVSAVVFALLYDIKPQTIVDALATLPKMRRYAEEYRDTEGRRVVVDGVRHPYYIGQLLTTLKAQYADGRLWCLFQPRSYLRTNALAKELRQALSLADSVFVADILGYPHEKSEGLHSRHFVSDMKQTHMQTYYVELLNETLALIRERAATHDTIVVLGDEDFTQSALDVLIGPEE